MSWSFLFPPKLHIINIILHSNFILIPYWSEHTPVNSKCLAAAGISEYCELLDGYVQKNILLDTDDVTDLKVHKNCKFCHTLRASQYDYFDCIIKQLLDLACAYMYDIKNYADLGQCYPCCPLLETSKSLTDLVFWQRYSSCIYTVVDIFHCWKN